ncbi:phosphoribosylglycinamide formyltransferase-1 [Chitinophaga terrae (ex Kim and Jung 2007)]|uniref:Phosphoribosylglycinamide formyltransferase n=1 Tax=Chitinophaga terrae (ex Kim and Jung 2007) TaxID=408074 RepID=A0A1H4DVH8_9BACT|nr:phosphoribosylglycinamide formyltransferase [Chitinophaga terrae (ex Kim and Jung 2007)]MDQ0104998.1 phosphoribosylglycinamide formyltransferase-1 [Chitinophaga terrae (ex Kim and Jung 2007)]SEA76805.1 phosphoribosylglycinamide formyltransferase-1 [Chitinophaga terrae (ex Kim and Jung 2007)]
MKNIAIFASGTGSNAQKIIDHFRHSDIARVTLIVCNKPGAGVLQIAERENIPSVLIDKTAFFNSDTYIKVLQDAKIDLVVLAGFLWKVPANLVQAFPNRIINIHPALLPKFGGKGMYGHFVHEAVIAAGEKESGITIHFVNEKYDDGETILQERCEITADDTPETVAKKVQALEHRWFPVIVERLLSKI